MKQEEQIPQVEFEQIERFIRNEMPPDEYHAFASRIERDPALAARVREIRLVMTGVGEAMLGEKLQKLHGETTNKGKVRPISKPRYWLAAAGIIGLLGIFIWMFSRPTENERLFTEFFEPDPGLMTSMGITDEYSFNRAMVDYKTGKYAEALATWEPMLASDIKNDTLNYFIGLSWLGEDEPKKAVILLRKIADDPASEFRIESYWYLGLALLKDGQVEEAKTFIARSDKPQRDELLSRLK